MLFHHSRRRKSAAGGAPPARCLPRIARHGRRKAAGLASLRSKLEVGIVHGNAIPIPSASIAVCDTFRPVYVLWDEENCIVACGVQFVLTNERNYGARADFVKYLRLSRRNLCYILLRKRKRRKTNTPSFGALRGVPAGRGRGCLKVGLFLDSPASLKLSVFIKRT